MQYAIEALDAVDFEKANKKDLQKKIDRYNNLEKSFNSEAFENFEFTKNCLENHLKHTYFSFDNENCVQKENSQIINYDKLSNDETVSSKNANLSSLEYEMYPTNC